MQEVQQTPTCSLLLLAHDQHKHLTKSKPRFAIATWRNTVTLYWTAVTAPRLTTQFSEVPAVQPHIRVLDLQNKGTISSSFWNPDRITASFSLLRCADISGLITHGKCAHTLKVFMRCHLSHCDWSPGEINWMHHTTFQNNTTTHLPK